MKNLYLRLALVSLLFLAHMPACAGAQESLAPTGQVWPEDKIAVLADVEDVGRKLIELAQAMPADKFGWRPNGEGLFSVSEVYLLAATRYYHMPSVWGGLQAKGYEIEGNAATAGTTEDPPLEKSTTNKVEVVNQLTDAVSYFDGMMKTLTDANMQKSIKILGRTTTPYLSLILMDADLHEFLAQAMNYARSNGVVLPWMNELQEEQRRRGLRTSIK
jgi:hypothetical protein